MDRSALVVFGVILLLVGMLFGNALRGCVDRLERDAACAAHSAIVGPR